MRTRASSNQAFKLGFGQGASTTDYVTVEPRPPTIDTAEDGVERVERIREMEENGERRRVEDREQKRETGPATQRPVVISDEDGGSDEDFHTVPYDHDSLDSSITKEDVVVVLGLPNGLVPILERDIQGFARDFDNATTELLSTVTKVVDMVHQQREQAHKDPNFMRLADAANPINGPRSQCLAPQRNDNQDHKGKRPLMQDARLFCMYFSSSMGYPSISLAVIYIVWMWIFNCPNADRNEVLFSHNARTAKWVDFLTLREGSASRLLWSTRGRVCLITEKNVEEEECRHVGTVVDIAADQISA
nr:uncharacterized protein LOC109150699 isoform X3 [Ipomoea batatas]